MRRRWIEKMSVFLLNIFLLLGSASFFGVLPAHAADVYCFCASPLDGTVPLSDATRQCTPLSSKALICAEMNQGSLSCAEDVAGCGTKLSEWDDKKAALLKSQAADNTKAKTKANSSGLIYRALPPCVFDADIKGECRSIGIFVKTAISLTNALLSIVGSLALLAFLYGGFILIISEGKQESIKQGTGAMTAAVIGLLIAFGGYLLVKYLGAVLGVQSGFNLL